MCAKKKNIPNKIWKIAGEPLRAQPLNAVEQSLLTDAFYAYRLPCGDNNSGDSALVPPAIARCHHSAAQAVAAFLCVRYADRYKREAVVSVISSAAAVPMPMAARMANQQGFLLGAALWLLDYWDEHCGDADEYLSLLPPEPDGELAFDIPFSGDLVHSWELIHRVMIVLCGREKEYRKEFQALLSLIDDNDAMVLRQQFRAAFLDYIDRALEVYIRLQPVDRIPPPFLGASLPRMDLLMEEDVLPTQRPEIISLLMATELICRPVEEIQNWLHSRKAAELLSSYGTDDPYALCAAYLLLEWEKDALVNLNCLTAVVMVCAERHLPWAQDDFDVRAEPFDQGRPDYRLRYKYSETAGDGDDVYPPQLFSETQLFFNATGVVLPRNQRPSEDLVHWFRSQGVSEQRARELAFGSMFAYYTDAGEHGWKEIDWPFDDDVGDEDAPLEEAEKQQSALRSTEDHAAQAELLARNRKVTELRGALHDAERAVRRLEDQLREAQRCGEADRAELAQLRENLYNLRAGEDGAEEDSEARVELPWQVRRRTVVFGGHDSWRKAVRPLLTGARFYNREALPDLDAIRGADVVWIQPNALSHKYYYRIIDAARKNGIPVRYFGFASAKKCALQFARDELSAQTKPG